MNTRPIARRVPIQQESLEGKVMTVKGLIDADEMEITLPHEHLLLYHTPDSVVLSDPDLAADELMEYAKVGGKTLVEVTNRGIRRDAIGLKYISDKTGVNIIMGCGYYKSKWHPADMDEKTVDEIAAEMIDDITVGVEGTGIRAGIIGEIGVSESLKVNEEKVVIASAQAQLKTGVAINIHLDINASAREKELRMDVLNLLEDEGVDLNRVIMSHFRPWMDEVDYHEKTAQRGVYVEYDLFGMSALHSPSIPTYEQETASMKELIERGFLERILISQDVCYGRLLVKNGGWGYAHILKDVVPRFRKNGITDDEIRTIMVENPKRVFPFSF